MHSVEIKLRFINENAKRDYVNKCNHMVLFFFIRRFDVCMYLTVVFVLSFWKLFFKFYYFLSAIVALCFTFNCTSSFNPLRSKVWHLLSTPMFYTPKQRSRRACFENRMKVFFFKSNLRREKFRHPYEIAFKMRLSFSWLNGESFNSEFWFL